MENISFRISCLNVEAKGKTILSVEELSLPNDCCTAIIGPNGAGKSTLLKALIRQAGKGNVSLFGADVAPQLKQGKVAWVGQHGQYQMPLTVREYIELGRYPHTFRTHKDREQTQRQADELLGYFDLSDLAEKRIGTLSGGEQQRANIIRALLQNAPILLLDEPCNHLDIRHQHRLMQYLTTHGKHFSTVMVLHDLNLAARYARHIILMNKGKIVSTGSVDEVMQSERLQAVYGWEINRVQDGRGVYFRV
ncbi:ABC transporter ATP-binding protein [Neisseria animaloris]|uniref:ABC transporter ATP-binding protein n=1 Tax=Neisseria animaloris TaxID=326522 RepID=UPI000D368739|nr:ABC transporter ATP-binding protein [Neisseria animaloris]